MFRPCVIVLSLLWGSVPAASLDTARPAPVASVRSVTQAQSPPSGCTVLEIRLITPPMAPVARISQHPVECAGFRHVARPRKVELVFQDTQLDLVWILFPAREKAPFLHAFAGLYGEPSLQVELGGLYLAAGAAVRSAPTGVLFASGRQARAMMAALRPQPSDSPSPPPSP